MSFISLMLTANTLRSVIRLNEYFEKIIKKDFSEFDEFLFQNNSHVTYARYKHKYKNWSIITSLKGTPHRKSFMNFWDDVDVKDTEKLYRLRVCYGVTSKIIYLHDPNDEFINDHLSSKDSLKLLLEKSGK